MTVHPPVYSPVDQEAQSILLLDDGTAYAGVSFGASRSIAGECVFQTGNLF